MLEHYPLRKNKQEIESFNALAAYGYSYQLTIEMYSILVNEPEFALFSKLCSHLVDSDLSTRKPDRCQYISIAQQVIIGGTIFFEEELAFAEDESFYEALSQSLSWQDLSLWQVKAGTYKITINTVFSRALAGFLEQVDQLPARLREEIYLHGVMSFNTDAQDDLAVFAYGRGFALKVTTTQDNPQNTAGWQEGALDYIGLQASWLCLSVDESSPTSWGNMIMHAMQLAALNKPLVKQMGSVYGALTSTDDLKKSLSQLGDRYFDFLSTYTLAAADRQVFKAALLNLLHVLRASGDEVWASFYDITFYNINLRYFELWQYDKEKHDFSIHYNKNCLHHMLKPSDDLFILEL